MTMRPLPSSVARLLLGVLLLSVNACALVGESTYYRYRAARDVAVPDAMVDAASDVHVGRDANDATSDIGPRDLGVGDVPNSDTIEPDAPALCGDGGAICGVDQLCCEFTGTCVAASCLSCCMFRRDAGPMDVPTHTDGPAPDAPRFCAADTDCGATEACVFATPGCGGAGICLPQVSCPTRSLAYCGCSGRSFFDTCAGPTQPWTHAGPCEDAAPPRCSFGRDCTGGLACCTETGSCYDPRCLSCCGSMGAVDAIDDAPVGCLVNADCHGTEYCEASGCRTPGFCVPRPLACIPFISPVCGCNGTTYGNACAANNMGVRVAARGPCPDAGATPAGCLSDLDCLRSTCCVRTGICYSPLCLSCCTPIVSTDAS